MEASILLVGGDDFLSTLLNRIRNLVSCTVEVAPTPSEAVPLIQAQQPDLIILQGNLPGGLELCRQIKDQARLAWIYCIVLDSPVQMLERAWLDRNWEMDCRIEALENGADAYLWLPQNDPHGEILEKEILLQQDRLLRAQIVSGLQMVKNHRELMRTNDILSAIALSDPLTELNNRRALDWELPRQVANARARAEPLSLVMLDVDYFKAINDTYGHPVGDRALQLISSRLRHNLRFRDTLFRYGGEEFVIILSNTDQQEALLVARRLCRLISDQSFAIEENLDLNLTISAGTASLKHVDDSRGASLLQRADQNLLQAKAAGRNRVFSCLDTSPQPDAENVPAARENE
ncbi:diguanylate cyclase [Kovacikia minuta CCNUW1]|uniref:GGDEF domain-containing response regulator n=1 Tax=Kovacikia minuta TaxID=2931930 RepID=UPI001CC9B7E8|nr:diguanylate cyclase [Kovacikia minuta]UBF26508.1 diguanylate cyclase [Kovacikia minuta CCNUW1]